MKLSFGLNPIIVKELRSRMRGGRAFLILTGMLVLLGGALYGLYRIMVANMFYTSMLSAGIGQTLFSGLALLLLAIICFITPAVTAGALSSEREKLTYDMLLTTPLRPGSILWGKLIGALSYIFLLIFAAVPLASLVFIFGGVAPKEMVKALIVLVTVAVTLGVTGIFFSVWLGRTARATVMSYLFVLLLMVGPLVAYIASGTIERQIPSRWLLIPNPVSALFSAMMPSLAPNNGGVLMSLGMALSGDLGRITGMDTRAVRPLYHYSLPFFATLTLLLYGLAAQQIQPIRRRRLRLSSLVTAALAVVLVGGGTFLAFQQTSGQYEGSIFSPAPTPTPFREAAVPMAMRAVEVRVERGPVVSTLPTRSALVDGLYATEEAVEIYDSAVEHFLADMDLPAGSDLLVARSTDDVVGFADVTVLPSHEVDETLQRLLSERLSTAGGSVRWLDQSAPEAPADAVALVLGNLRMVDNQRVLVSVSAHVAGGQATGRAYVLMLEADAWQVAEIRASWGE